MIAAAYVVSGAVVLIHLYIFWMETIAWESPRVRKIFGTDPEFAAKTKVLAGNQGVYNLVLALMLLRGLWLGTSGAPLTVSTLFGVLLVGLYGAATVGRKILFVQVFPAALAIAVWLLT